MTGVMEFGVFFPEGKTRMPKITPTLLFRLYSIAGASANAWLERRLSEIGVMGSETL